MILSIVLSTFILPTQVLEKKESLKIGQVTGDSLHSCYVTDDWDSVRELQVPRQICIEKVALTVHPKDPFSRPLISIHFHSDAKNPQKVIDRELTGGQPCFPNVKDSEYLKASLSLDKKTILQEGRSSSIQQNTILDFCFNQESGWFHTSTPQLTVYAQRMIDEYHPDGEIKKITYRFDD